MDNILIHTENIKLDALLKFAGEVETGGEAKHLILNGNVTVNDELCTQRGRKIFPGDIISLNGKRIKVAADNET